MAGVENEPARGLVLAADVEPERFEDLVSQMKGVPGLIGVKIGFEIGLGYGELREAVEVVHESGLIAVYDHQKAANDIPATGINFARAMKRARVDAAIIFPYTGPVTQEVWTKELQDADVRVITGGEMTHDQIAASPDGLSEGYVSPAAFARMYNMAVDLGVTDFVVPGNKAESVTKYREEIFDPGLGHGNYKAWAPGFVTQGGNITETGEAAGEKFAAISGSAIYNADDPRAAATALGQSVLSL